MVFEMLSDINVTRWMQCATNDMLWNNTTDIRCPCRRCKLECVTEPDSGILERHLKHNGLMELVRRRTSMVGRQEMRKGNQTTTAGEKTKSISYMIMKIKMPDMKIKMSDMRIQD